MSTPLTRWRSNLFYDAGRAGASRCRCAEPAVHSCPIHVRKEGVDVLCSFARRIVQHEGVLPDVHNQERFVARRMAVLMQRDPVVAQTTAGRILVSNRPTDSAHPAYGLKVSHESVKAAKVALNGLFQ